MDSLAIVSHTGTPVQGVCAGAARGEPAAGAWEAAGSATSAAAGPARGGRAGPARDGFASEPRQPPAGAGNEKKKIN